MRLTLIHNPAAGHQAPTREDLLQALRDAGHEAAYQSVKGPHLAEVLRAPGDLVLVAGGDGTIRRAARHLVGRGIPMAVLPIGTANNISKTLGVTGDPRDLIAGLASARRILIDVGVARGPWGQSRFLEAVGFGLFPELMAGLEADGADDGAFRHAEEEIEHDLHALTEALGLHEPRDCQLRLDEADLSGRYLFVEALNMRTIGPNLNLASDADPADGLLDVALLPEAQREVFQNHLRQRLDGLEMAPGITVRRGSRLQLSIGGNERLHIDDALWPKEERPRGGGIDAEVTLEPRALEFLVPG
jgi:diacylglycerol kinase (ATP)